MSEFPPAIGEGGGEVGIDDLVRFYLFWGSRTREVLPPEEFHRALLAIAAGNTPPCFAGFPLHEAKIYRIVTVLIYSNQRNINSALDELFQLAEENFVPATILLIEILLGMIEDLDQADTWRDDETGVVRALRLLFWSTESGHWQERFEVKIRVFRLLRDYGMCYSEGRHPETDVHFRIRKLYKDVARKHDDDENMIEKVREFVEWVTKIPVLLDVGEPSAKRTRH